MAYPEVMSEEETLAQILAGKSIARFGDGEFNHVRGKKNVSQVVHEGLTAELVAVLLSPPKSCLVGIPRLDVRNPKNANWQTYATLYARHLTENVNYASAFISRPDNAPWINTPEFYDGIESLWRGQDVTLVANGERSLKPDFLEATGARSVTFVQCAYRDAYVQIDSIEEECRRVGQRTLLCAGPTATVLAVRLARRGIHAVDLGHIGMFWRPYANPKLQNRAEQREINKESGTVEPNP